MFWPLSWLGSCLPTGYIVRSSLVAFKGPGVICSMNRARVLFLAVYLKGFFWSLERQYRVTFQMEILTLGLVPQDCYQLVWLNHFISWASPSTSAWRKRLE